MSAHKGLSAGAGHTDLSSVLAGRDSASMEVYMFPRRLSTVTSALLVSGRAESALSSLEKSALPSLPFSTLLLGWSWPVLSSINSLRKSPGLS